MTADGLRKWEVVYSQISLCGLKTFIVCCSSQSPVWFFVTPRTAARQASLAFTVSWSLLRFMPLGWWCYLTISSSATLFSFCLQSFPATGSFPWVSSSHQVAKVLELQLQHQFFQAWFPLGLTVNPGFIKVIHHSVIIGLNMLFFIFYFLLLISFVVVVAQSFLTLLQPHGL